MIKNLIFDMGNVLIRFNREQFLDRVGATGEDRALLTKGVFLSAEWPMQDRGVLTEEEAAEKMCARLPARLHKTAYQLVTGWHSQIIPVPGMAELVGELKQKGYGIYLLSNAGSNQHEYWPRIPGSEYFDGTVISADIQLVKPQPEIYLYTLQHFKLKAEECVFIDDSNVNVEGAIWSGLPAIVFHGDASELRADLKALGVDI